VGLGVFVRPWSVRLTVDCLFGSYRIEICRMPSVVVELRIQNPLLMSQDFFFRSLSIWRRYMVLRCGTVSSRLPTGRILGVVSHCYCLSRDCYFRASQQRHTCSLSAKHRERRASVLRTTLFVLIFNRMVNAFGWQLWTLLGVDDLILFCVSRNSDTIESLLQVAVHRVSH